jgi:hypothetical protein
MKRILFFFIISMMTVIVQAADSPSKERVLGKLASLPGVESVYIGPAALRLAFSSANAIPGIPAGVKNITSVEVIDCSNKESESQIRNFVKKLVKQRKFEEIVENASEGERTVIYGYVPDSSTSTLNNVLIENSEDGEYVLVYIEGTINIAELTSGK